MVVLATVSCRVVNVLVNVKPHFVSRSFEIKSPAIVISNNKFFCGAWTTSLADKHNFYSP